MFISQWTSFSNNLQTYDLTLTIWLLSFWENTLTRWHHLIFLYWIEWCTEKRFKSTNYSCYYRHLYVHIFFWVFGKIPIFVYLFFLLIFFYFSVLFSVFYYLSPFLYLRHAEREDSDYIHSLSSSLSLSIYIYIYICGFFWIILSQRNEQFNKVHLFVF